jgi:hypothetical protein
MNDVVNKKQEKFKELAEDRANKAIDRIRSIGNLANGQNYVWQEEQVKKILEVIREAVNEVESKFYHAKKRTPEVFKL